MNNSYSHWEKCEHFIFKNKHFKSNCSRWNTTRVSKISFIAILKENSCNVNQTNDNIPFCFIRQSQTNIRVQVSGTESPLSLLQQPALCLSTWLKHLSPVPFTLLVRVLHLCHTAFFVNFILFLIFLLLFNSKSSASVCI